MSPTTPEQMTSVIVEMSGRYLSDHYDSLRDINSGGCEDFAYDVIEALRSVSDTSEVRELDIGMFLVPAADGDDNNYGYPMDRECLEGIDTLPPEGLSWEDLDHLSCHGSFSPGTHIWLALAGRHYDAEAPQGVAGIFDLPFFRRRIASWIENGRPEPQPLTRMWKQDRPHKSLAS